MAVIRVHKNKNYTVMSNHHFREREMTLKAKGLLSLMLSLPDDWDYSIAGLVSICAEKESAIVSTLKELRNFGYLWIEKRMPNETESGRIEYTYHIFEKPNQKLIQFTQKQAVEKQGIENLPLENQGIENQGQLNTKEQNTKKESTKGENTKDKKKNKKEKGFEKIIEEYLLTVAPEQREEIKSLLTEWIKVRKAKRAVLTDKSIEMNLQKLEEYAAESGMTISDYLSEVIRRGWVAFFAINTQYQQAQARQNQGYTNTNGNVFLDIAKDEGIF